MFGVDIELAPHSVAKAGVVFDFGAQREQPGLESTSVGLRLRLLPRWQGNTSCHCHSGRDTNAEEQRWLVTPCLTSGWNHRSRAQMPQILPRARPRRRGRGRHGMPAPLRCPARRTRSALNWIFRRLSLSTPASVTHPSYSRSNWALWLRL